MNKKKKKEKREREREFLIRWLMIGLHAEQRLENKK